MALVAVAQTNGIGLRQSTIKKHLSLRRGYFRPDEVTDTSVMGLSKSSAPLQPVSTRDVNCVLLSINPVSSFRYRSVHNHSVVASIRHGTTLTVILHRFHSSVRGQRDSCHHYAKSDQTPSAYLNRALEL